MFVSPAHVAFTAGQYYFHKKVTMPYLRGSMKKTSYKKASLENKVAKLSRQVARNTAAKEYFRFNSGLTNSLTGYNSFDVSITNLVTGTSDFRDILNGDKWYNKHLLLKGLTFEDVSSCRVMVYMPKKAGTFFSPSNNSTGFTQAMDPAAFTVLTDYYLTIHDQSQRATFNKWINLKSAMTTYNESSSALEKGDVRVQIFWFSNAASGAAQGHLGMQLCVQDK